LFSLNGWLVVVSLQTEVTDRIGPTDEGDNDSRSESGDAHQPILQNRASRRWRTHFKKKTP
jgi:hypothetical protein